MAYIKKSCPTTASFVIESIESLVREYSIMYDESATSEGRKAHGETYKVEILPPVGFGTRKKARETDTVVTPSRDPYPNS
jgi:hypothetical protein